MTRANDSVRHHLIGANLTLRHKRLELQLTAVENIYSDSIRPYRNAAYNAHYFRGRTQAVIGASARYNHGWFDAFAELATAQSSNSQILKFSNPRWGIALIAGSRFYPASGVTLIGLYRYYSPSFDNALGYAFSESSRIGDENGGYLGFDITRLRNWRFLGYGDIFYFTGPKYGIPSSPTLGYDAMAEVQYHSPLRQSPFAISVRLRAKKKDSYVYSARVQADVTRGAWSFRTVADANYAGSYGLSIAQDVALDFSRLASLSTRVPLALTLRLQGFDVREWANRIYLYEHDVLYSFSIPATYGLGGRGYICLRWQIIPQLSLYFKFSETVYAKQWAASQSRPSTRTDIHLLLRAKL
jgi:hypothetical protein